MELATIIELISTMGFPMACVIVLGWFVYQIYKRTTDENAANMEKVQERCKEREEKLYQEIRENREINAQAIATIALYADRLTHIETNIDEIKNDVTEIKGKIN